MVCQFSLLLLGWRCETAETESAREPRTIEGDLSARIVSLLPVVVRNERRPGRKRLESGKVMCWIPFVLYTGIRWEFLPQAWAWARV